MTLKLVKLKFNNRLLFLLIPLVLVFLLLIRKEIIHYFFMWNHDPSYAYLINGLNIANGTFSIGHYDHPGTPLQILIAIVLKVVFWITGEGDITTHVLDNTEFYLSCISYFLIGINAIAIYFIGNLYFKATKSVHLAILIQCSPFLSKHCILFMPMVMTEALFPLLLLLIITVTFIYIEKPTEKSGIKILSLGIIAGVAFATKISVVLILLLPLFIIRPFLNKLKYLSYALITFFVTTLPIIQHYHKFTIWIKNLITHSGRFGSGSNTIIDSHIYLENLKQTFTTQWVFTFLILMFFVFQIIFWINCRKLKNKSYLNTYSIINLLIVFNILLVAKHYSFHYLIPVQLLFVPQIILILRMVGEYKWMKDLVKSPKLISHIVLILFILFLIFYNLPKPLNKERYQTSGLESIDFISKNLSNKPVIIEIPQRTSIPFIEVGLFFGSTYAGEIRNTYFDYFYHKFPHSYFYNASLERIYNWKGEITSIDLSETYDTIYYYTNAKTASGGNLLAQEFIKDSLLVYYNDKTGDRIYKLVIDNRYSKSFMLFSARCDMEMIHQDSIHFVTNDSLRFFSNIHMRNSDKSYSGNYSVKFNPSDLYGPLTNIKVHTGDIIKLSFYRYPEKSNAVLVASLQNSSAFYKAANMGRNVTDNWERVELNFIVPKTINDSVLKVYAFVPGNEETFIDDFEIKHWIKQE